MWYLCIYISQGKIRQGKDVGNEGEGALQIILQWPHWAGNNWADPEAGKGTMRFLGN